MATLVVFRNNISHARYNEARAHLSVVKNGIRSVLSIVSGCGVNVNEGERAVVFRKEVAEIARQLQVRWSPHPARDVTIYHRMS